MVYEGNLYRRDPFTNSGGYSVATPAPSTGGSSAKTHCKARLPRSPLPPCPSTSSRRGRPSTLNAASKSSSTVQAQSVMSMFSKNIYQVPICRQCRHPVSHTLRGIRHHSIHPENVKSHQDKKTTSLTYCSMLS